MPNDTLFVEVSNGAETVVLEAISESNSFWRERSSFLLSDYLSITDDMQVQFRISDYDNSGHIVEAAVDAFAITGELVTNTVEQLSTQAALRIHPNPFTHIVYLDMPQEWAASQAWVTIYNELGQVVKSIQGTGQELAIDLSAWPKGVYTLVARAPNHENLVTRIVKQ
ncbi:MAG: T9SS type A sorting domain-containing protein [Saprospiraceae bacterium]